MNDRVRGFPAFPKGSRRARSWWGRAWIKALEDTALDAQPLRQGRRYAYAGRVGTITVSPGRIAAPVDDQTHGPCRTEVFVAQLGDAEWDRFLDQIASTAGHIAALLDKDMPPELVAAAQDAGVALLPGIGDLEPECTCPGWELPCTHAAALCYQASWLLDADPWVLLLLRGRGERELLAELHRRNAGPVETRSEPVVGTPADEAYRRIPAPLPDPPPLVAAGPPLAVRAAPGVDPEALRWLVIDAAARARELLTALEPPPVLDEWEDSVRMAAGQADPRLHERLARGRSADELARAVRAWQHGGAAGLEVLTTAWSPPRSQLARAWAGEDAPEPTVWRNRCTVAGRQLRLGRDGRWYPYREKSGEWWPAGQPWPDPSAALAELLSE